MKPAYRLSAAALVLAYLAASPAQAQDAATQSTAEELAAMRAQLQTLTQRIDQLEAELETAEAQIAQQQANAQQPAPVASAAKAGTVPQTATAPQVAAATSDETTISWKGGPQIDHPDGWSFKPRGRIQVDAGSISRPDGITDGSTGFGTEIRRAYLGIDGNMPGGIGYRAEVDLADNNVEITDLYLSYSPSKSLTLLIGQSKPFWGLEEMTSDLFTSLTERAAFNSAFGFERRVGIAANWKKGIVLLQGGVFTDNIEDLGGDENNSLSYDGRVVLMPKLGGGQLHLGASAHYRDFNDGIETVRYRARPFIHTPDIRFVDTAAIDAVSETGYGLEAAYIHGPFHVSGETHWQRVGRIGGTNPTFFGGYAEVGYFLTQGDSRGYKGGVFDRTKPTNPITDGGIGAVQIVLRYDHLDLVDAAILGGAQNTFGIGLSWHPTAYTKLMANYGHINYDDAAIATTDGNRDYNVDAFGVRAQIDF